MTKGKAVLYRGLDSRFEVQQVEVFSISRKSAHGGGKVVGPRHKPT